MRLDRDFKPLVYAAGVMLDQVFQQPDFFAQFGPLYNWSVDHECHFFVRLFDETGPSEKAAYKQQTRIVQSVFYAYEPPNGRF